jgi:uncharacterized protein YnzC (UPF0291/DUF896 family)
VEQIKDKINAACKFPKAMSYQDKDIYVDVKKLTSTVRKIETLTKEEKQELQNLKNLELQKFHSEVNRMFDSNKNWSIMIDQKHNEIRNEVMQKVKFEQLKKRCLHDFMRKTREELIRKRASAGAGSNSVEY